MHGCNYINIVSFIASSYHLIGDIIVLTTLFSFYLFLQSQRIFAAVLKTTSSVPALYESALLADDDNGDLSDGTPNVCSIDSAFANHGLTSARFGVLKVEHEQRAYVSADAAIVFDATVQVSRPECSDASVGNVRLLYTTDPTAGWTTATMDSAGDDAEGALSHNLLDLVGPEHRSRPHSVGGR